MKNSHMKAITGFSILSLSLGLGAAAYALPADSDSRNGVCVTASLLSDPSITTEKCVYLDGKGITEDTENPIPPGSEGEGGDKEEPPIIEAPEEPSVPEKDKLEPDVFGPATTQITYKCTTDTAGVLPFRDLNEGTRVALVSNENEYVEPEVENKVTKEVTMKKDVEYKAVSDGSYVTLNHKSSKLSNCVKSIDYWGEDAGIKTLSSLGKTNFTVPSNIPRSVNSLYRAFTTSSFNDPNVITWDTSNVGSFYDVFSYAKDFNQPIGNWDTSSARDMGRMFYYAEKFDQDISGWNTSNVENISNMFSSTPFNYPLNGWDTSKIENMRGVFEYNSKFNQPLDNWKTHNVKNMNAMFDQTSSFNQDISGWDTSNVKDMEFMFRAAYKFNQDISGWNTSNVESMHQMFAGSYRFNQDISGWNTSNVINMGGMFDGASDIKQDLSGWKVDNVTNSQYFANMSGMRYYPELWPKFKN